MLRKNGIASRLKRGTPAQHNLATMERLVQQSVWQVESTASRTVLNGLSNTAQLTSNRTAQYAEIKIRPISRPASSDLFVRKLLSQKPGEL